MMEWKEQFNLQLEGLSRNQLRLDWNSNRLQNHLLKKENLALKSEIASLGVRVDEAKEALKTKEESKELVSKIQELKNENTDLYKTNAINSARILDLLDQHARIDKTIREKDELIASLQEKLTSAEKNLKDLTKSNTEKEQAIQVLRDEMSTIQLELNQRELKWIETEKENKVLLDRWIEAKEKEAAKMNEANLFLESALKTRDKVFSFFQSPPVVQRQESKEKDPIPSSILPTKLEKIYKSNHEDQITSLAVSPDGGLLATGGSDRKVHLISIGDGVSKGHLLGNTQSVMSLQFDSTGESILSTSNDNTIKLYSTATNRLTLTLTGHTSKIYSAKFIQQEQVVSCSHDRTIKLWDLKKGYCTKTIFTLSSCNDVEIGGGMLYSGHFDNNLRVWDVTTGALVREVTGLHLGQITGVCASQDGQKILTMSRDNTCKIIDSRMFLPLATLSSPNFRVGCNWSKCTFSPDGVYVAAGGMDGKVYIWQDSNLVKVLEKHTSNVCGVVWCPLGGSALFSVAEGDKYVAQWGD